MLILLAVAVVAGLLTGRAVVAESDAHRLGQPDRWLAPVCVVCGGELTLTTVRCRTQRHPQRRWNLVIILITAAVFVAMVFSVPSLWVWPGYAVFGGACVLLTVTDLDTKLIPNRILGPSVVVGPVLLVVGWLFATDSGSPLRALGGGLAYFAVMYVLALIARGGLGFGDVKLAFLIGLFAGYLSWGAVVVAGVGGFLIGGVVSVGLLVGRTRGRKDEIPFGPFMTVAGVVAVVWGAQIVSWYSG